MVPQLQLPHVDGWDLNLYELEEPASIPDGSMLAGTRPSETQPSYSTL